jgi:DNA (cytosine-5)-methyltransferase 1
VALPSVVRIASLCTGGGGLDLGVSRALARLGCGHRAILYVEREAYAAACLAARMGEGTLSDAPIWSDLVGFDGKRFRGTVDLIVAGVPCQGNSVAGKRRGRDDDRWLWPDVARILDELHAPWLFLENVRGLLAVDDGAAFGEILESLARRGFNAEWLVLGARDVGAPHRRERVFLLAYAEHSRLVGGGAAYDDDGRHAPGHDVNGCDAPMVFPPAPDDADGWRAYLAERPELAPAIEPAIRGSAHGVAERLERAVRIDRLRLLGNGVVPQQAAVAFVRLLERIRSNDHGDET